MLITILSHPCFGGAIIINNCKALVACMWSSYTEALSSVQMDVTRVNSCCDFRCHYIIIIIIIKSIYKAQDHLRATNVLCLQE